MTVRFVAWHRFFTFLFLVPLFLVSLPLAAHAAGHDVALVTALSGKVVRIEGGRREPLQAFVKLRQGDFLALEEGARIELVFFSSRRQEDWRGTGRLEIAEDGGRGLGLEPPAQKTLPDVMVRQMAKTPALDSQGRAGVVRLRAFATPEALARLENDYRRMRMEVARNDLNPEIFLLASLLEMRQADRLEAALSDLQMSHQGNTEAGLLVSLYRRALKDLREGGQ